MLLVERSKFGLNELLGACLDTSDHGSTLPFVLFLRNVAGSQQCGELGKPDLCVAHRRDARLYRLAIATPAGANDKPDDPGDDEGKHPYHHENDEPVPQAETSHASSPKRRLTAVSAYHQN